jgi:hypothetical protein
MVPFVFTQMCAHWRKFACGSSGALSARNDETTATAGITKSLNRVDGLHYKSLVEGRGSVASDRGAPELDVIEMRFLAHKEHLCVLKN